MNILSNNDTHDRLMVAFSQYVKENENFENHGVKISAQRARRALNEIKSLIVQRRKELQEKKLQT